MARDFRERGVGAGLSVGWDSSGCGVSQIEIESTVTREVPLEGPILPAHKEGVVELPGSCHGLSIYEMIRVVYMSI